MNDAFHLKPMAPRVGMIDDRIQDNTALNGLSYFSLLVFAFPLCHCIFKSTFERNDVMLSKRKRGGFPIFLSC